MIVSLAKFLTAGVAFSSVVSAQVAGAGAGAAGAAGAAAADDEAEAAPAQAPAQAPAAAVPAAQAGAGAQAGAQAGAGAAVPAGAGAGGVAAAPNAAGAAGGAAPAAARPIDSTTGPTDFSDLVGTWTTKSKKVVTGPDFYNPVDDQFIEPDLPGISYSFTSDGFYEEAYYRAQSNPTDPKCPKGVMQWQHGKLQKYTNGSLVLSPIKVDGRQLVSDPCQYKESAYTRYNQWELFERYEVVLDGFHNVKRLNLFEFDGKPMAPMYLEYDPPQMLPTSTLNPTTAATGSGGQASATGSSKRKRSLPDNNRLEKFLDPQSRLLEPDNWWWFGVICTGMGTVAYVFF